MLTRYVSSVADAKAKHNWRGMSVDDMLDIVDRHAVTVDDDSFMIQAWHEANASEAKGAEPKGPLAGIKAIPIDAIIHLSSVNYSSVKKVIVALRILAKSGLPMERFFDLDLFPDEPINTRNLTAESKARMQTANRLVGKIIDMGYTDEHEDLLHVRGRLRSQQAPIKGGSVSRPSPTRSNLHRME